MRNDRESVLLAIREADGAWRIGPEFYRSVVYSNMRLRGVRCPHRQALAIRQLQQAGMVQVIPALRSAPIPLLNTFYQASKEPDEVPAHAAAY